jgi:two-component system CheB/CheR fusion protein
MSTAPEKSTQNIKQENQEWLNVFDVLEDPIFIYDKDFRLLRCNQAYQQYAKIPHEQIIGQPYFDVFPKTADSIHRCIYEEHNTISTETTKEIVVGDTIFQSRVYCIKDEYNTYLYSINILENISTRLQMQQMLQTSERQYRRLFEAAKDGILILDAETGVIIDANPFILHLLSYAFDEMIGKKLWEIGLFSDITKSKVSFKELQTKKYIRYDDLPLKTKAGRQIDVEFVSNLYTVDQKNVIQCNIRNITERKKMENALLEKDKIMMIQSRQAAMGDMIAMIAHQWRQPLSIVGMEINNLKLSMDLDEEITTELLTKHIECINEQVQQLSQTIDDFRDFFKPDQIKETVRVSDVIEKTMRIIGKSLENNNIDVVIENNSETTLETYPNQLLQVFLNILNNAKDVLKTLPIPNAKVLITINDTDESIVTTICDNGGGIPKNIIERVGEPYFTTKKTEGTGLGLYMSKTIVTEHLNGKFDWANRDGGACFSISLPK